jgi:DNA-binding MarR family transcriptional regulator
VSKNLVAGGVSGDNDEITLGVLNAVHNNEAVTQRSVADELGVALGLVNAYLKRCVRKGYVKIQQAPRNRYAYYLTPTGFAEKGRLTAEYLSQGFKFFGNARREIGDIYRSCEEQGLRNIAIYGLSDLAEIAVLCASDAEVQIVAIVDAAAPRDRYVGSPVVRDIRNVAGLDAILLADTANPQDAYETLARIFPEARIFMPPMLNVSRKRPVS